MDEDNIDGWAEQARHFNIDFRTELQPNGEWTAIDDRTYDGAPDGNNMMGWGKTEQEAKEDLVRLFEEQADYWQMVHEEESERRGCNGF